MEASLQAGATEEFGYCVHLECLFDATDLFFTMLTLNHSQLFFLLLCPHLVLALGFDVFPASSKFIFAASVFDLGIIHTHSFITFDWINSSCPVLPQSLVFPRFFQQPQEGRMLEVRTWTSRLPTVASVFSALNGSTGTYLTSQALLRAHSI